MADFHRTLRHVVKAIHPEAILVGPANAEPADLGSFDALADPRAFDVLRRLLAPSVARLSPTDAARSLADVYVGIQLGHLPATWSVAGGPEAPRLTTAFATDSPPTFSNMPSEDATRRAVPTPPGHASRAPHVLYGDDVGRLGGPAPDGRCQMLWSDLDYVVDRSAAGTVPVRPDAALRDLTGRALRLRVAQAALFARGTLDWDAEGDVLRFVRRTATEEAVVAVNVGAERARVATQAPRAGAAFVRSTADSPETGWIGRVVVSRLVRPLLPGSCPARSSPPSPSDSPPPPPLRPPRPTPSPSPAR